MYCELPEAIVLLLNSSCAKRNIGFSLALIKLVTNKTILEVLVPALLGVRVHQFNIISQQIWEKKLMDPFFLSY